MAIQESSSLLEYLVVVVKWKRFLLELAAGLFVVSYVLIYLLIPPQYESKAVIVPVEEKTLGNISSLMKNIASLPGGLGKATANTDFDLYSTVVMSRTTAEDLITRFGLLEDYNLTSMEKAVKRFHDHLRTEVTDRNSYEITILASSPEKAAEMINYLLERMNKEIIGLNSRKSHDNRVFLEARYNEMMQNLRSAEDSLQKYQEQSGMFEAKEQTRVIIQAYSKVEAELRAKQLELSILENTLSADAPALSALRTEIREYENSLRKMRTQGGEESVLLALNALPSKAKTYVRHFRDVEIYSKILEFLVPLYEQSRFEEQKDVPVLQVIDRGIAPEKKAYPPRSLFAAVITFGGLVLAFFYALLQEHDDWKRSEKIVFIRENLRRWRRSP